MNERRDADPGGGALRCAEARVLLMGLMDGELGAHDKRRVEDHLAVCPACRAELASYQRLGRATDELGRQEINVSTELAWERIYDRIARQAGWALLWVGITLLSGYGLWQLGSNFLLASNVPLVLRLGVGAFGAGALLLLVNVVRERLFRHKTERYNEVQR